MPGPVHLTIRVNFVRGFSLRNGTLITNAVANHLADFNNLFIEALILYLFI